MSSPFRRLLEPRPPTPSEKRYDLVAWIGGTTGFALLIALLVFGSTSQGTPQDSVRVSPPPAVRAAATVPAVSTETVPAPTPVAPSPTATPTQTVLPPTQPVPQPTPTREAVGTATTAPVAQVPTPAATSQPAVTATPSSQPSATSAPTAAPPVLVAVEIDYSDADRWQFRPATITIPVGTTVRWTNKSIQPHTVTDKDEERTFDSGLLQAGKTFEVTFQTPGEVPYFCRVHPWIVGSVTVTEAPDRQGLSRA